MTLSSFFFSSLFRCAVLNLFVSSPHICCLSSCVAKSGPKDSTETMKYTAGVYTSSILFQNSALDVQVIVDESRIHSISLVNLDESVSAMYPLVEPALEELTNQIVEKQSLENISYSANSQYTSQMLLNAIESALEKAAIPVDSRK